MAEVKAWRDLSVVQFLCKSMKAILDLLPFLRSFIICSVYFKKTTILLTLLDYLEPNLIWLFLRVFPIELMWWFADHLFQYKNSDYFKIIKQCSITLYAIFGYNDHEPHCIISKYDIENCKTCNILITDSYFTSSLTIRTFHTRSHNGLSCKSTNLIYELECNFCGLVYLGETQERLNKRMCSHRSEINITKFPTFYQHLNQQVNSILSMKIRVLEKKITILRTVPF